MQARFEQSLSTISVQNKLYTTCCSLFCVPEKEASEQIINEAPNWKTIPRPLFGTTIPILLLLSIPPKQELTSNLQKKILYRYFTTIPPTNTSWALPCQRLDQASMF